MSYRKYSFSVVLFETEEVKLLATGKTVLVVDLTNLY